MGGEDKLHIGIQAAYHADELLLPFDVQGGFRGKEVITAQSKKQTRLDG